MQLWSNISSIHIFVAVMNQVGNPVNINIHMAEFVVRLQRYESTLIIICISMITITIDVIMDTDKNP